MLGAALVSDVMAGARLVRHHEAVEAGAHVGSAVYQACGEAGRGHQRGRPDGGAIKGVVKG